MPAIWSFGPDNTTGIDLSANAFWRLCFGAGFINQSPWLTLAMIYPPGPGQTTAQTQIALAKVSIPLAASVEEVSRIAVTAITSGSYEADLSRMTESFNLFKNNPKFKQELLDISLKEATDLLKAYWKVRDWLMAGAESAYVDVTVGNYTIKLKP